MKQSERFHAPMLGSANTESTSSGATTGRNANHGGKEASWKQVRPRKCAKMRPQNAHYVKENDNENENENEKCELTARRHGRKLGQRKVQIAGKKKVVRIS